MSSPRRSTAEASRSVAELWSAASPELGRPGSRVAEAQGVEQAAVHQQVGIAADGRREVQVGRAGQPRVPGLVGGVVRLAQRPQHQRPERRRRRGRRPGGARRRRRRPRRRRAGPRARAGPRGSGGRGHVQLGQLLVEQLDAALGGVLVVAEDRRAAAGDEVAGDGLVGRDHALLHQGVRRGLALQVDPGHAVAREGDHRLGRGGLERPAGQPPVAQRPRPPAPRAPRSASSPGVAERPARRPARPPPGR